MKKSDAETGLLVTVPILIAPHWSFEYPPLPFKMSQGSMASQLLPQLQR